MDERVFTLSPQVALRPEPFGALAYHYRTRRLVFLRHPDLVTVLRALDPPRPLGAVLEDCAIDPARRPAIATAIATLHRSEMVDELVSAA